MLALLPSQASASGADADIKLNPGQAAFWDGEGSDQAHVPHPALCGVSGPCWEYRINVNQDGWRLRVALSAVFRDPRDVHLWSDFLVATETIFDLQVLEVLEDGAEILVASGSTHAERATAYAVEVFVRDPGKGIYKVRVIPRSVTDMAFRMRAKLENEPPETTDPAPFLSPNLRTTPPFEFNFFTPTVTYGPGSGQPAPAASCMAEEIEEAMAEEIEAAIEAGVSPEGPQVNTPPMMCLRSSLGIENAGDGRLSLVFDFDARDPGKDCEFAPAKPTTCTLFQRRWNANGAEEEEWHEAGEAAFHVTHAHWHVQRIFDVRLLRVAEDWQPGGPAPKELEQLPYSGRKLGVWPGDEHMADWHRFWPACAPEPVSPKCHHDRGGGSGQITLQAGWGDIYEYNRSGNYVPFPQAPDQGGIPQVGVPWPGYYVLRAKTGPSNLIESDESDNVSYALIKVSTDGDVRLIERGYGTDPWDPRNEVVEVAP